MKSRKKENLSMYVKIKPCKNKYGKWNHTIMNMKNGVAEVITSDANKYYFHPEIDTWTDLFYIDKTDAYEVTGTGEPICQKK